MAEYDNNPAQYHIWYKDTIIESTGYLPSLKVAKTFARKRYGSEVQIEVAYPPSYEDGVKHSVGGK